MSNMNNKNKISENFTPVLLKQIMNLNVLKNYWYISAIWQRSYMEKFQILLTSYS